MHRLCATQFDYKLPGDEAIDGVACWKIESRPKQTKSSQYTSSIVWAIAVPPGLAACLIFCAQAQTFSKRGFFDTTLQDLSLDRPALPVRRLRAIQTQTVHAGDQQAVFALGKADLLNPIDRFAPKDFLSVLDTEVLAIAAVRLTYAVGSNSFDTPYVSRDLPPAARRS